MSSQSLGGWPADAGLLRPKLPPGRTSAGGNSRGVTWRAPVTRVGENQSVFVKSLDRIHSLAVRKWTPHVPLRSTKRIYIFDKSLANDSHLRSHKIDSHSTPITRFRGLLQALLNCHSCRVINYIAKDRYAPITTSSNAALDALIAVLTGGL
jgi:hypothetical protein